MPICRLALWQTLSTCTDQVRVEVSQTPRYLYDWTCSIGKLSTVSGVTGWWVDLFLEITMYLHLFELNFSKLLVVHAGANVINILLYKAVASRCSYRSDGTFWHLLWKCSDLQSFGDALQERVSLKVLHQWLPPCVYIICPPDVTISLRWKRRQRRPGLLYFHHSCLCIMHNGS